MGVDSNQNDSPKAEVGEIDTRAPFESVRDAVSLFGEVADRLASRKPKPSSSESQLPKETQLGLVQKELKKLQLQLNSAETTRTQALAELEVAKRTVLDLTHQLETSKESKEASLKETESAKNQMEQFSDQGVEDPWKKQGVENSRERHAAAVAELEAAKQELRRIRKDFETALGVKRSAMEEEEEAKELSENLKEEAKELSEEIAEVQDSVAIISLEDDQWIRRREALEELEKKVAYLKEEVYPEANKVLEAELLETDHRIGNVQKEIDFNSLRTELDDAKEVLRKLAEEEASLRISLESLKLELESVKKEHVDLKEKDSETESIVGSLHVKLRKCKAELEAAMAAETRAMSSSDELVLALRRLSVESMGSEHEAEAIKKQVVDTRAEADAAHAALSETEKNLRVALEEAEEARAAEAKAEVRIKALSEKSNGSRVSVSESGDNIRISAEEFESLSRKVEESEKLADMKVLAAMAQVEAVKASENEAIKRLESARKEIEDVHLATEEALKRAAMADAAKMAVEGEMKRWREREQKKTMDDTSRAFLEPLPARSKVPGGKTEKQAVGQKTAKAPALKKALSGMFQRKKSSTSDGGGSPATYGGEKSM